MCWKGGKPGGSDMLRVVILLAVLLWVCDGKLTLEKEQNVLTPPYFNIASGKKIEATATCGQTSSQLFCKLTGGPNEDRYGESLYEGAVCDVCDDTQPAKSHPIRYAIDGTEKWWQSPPLSQGDEYNKINLTVHLGQVYHVAYIIIKFANSPRAGTWVLERSSDFGENFHPWQYFANSDSGCINEFGVDPFEEITRDDSVMCTSEYSGVVPLERGEVIVSTVNRRPGANNFSHSSVLQEWTKATDIRLRLIRTNTLLGHLMAVQRQDPTVTRRYYYSIKDISIGGRCVCHGHADTCIADKDDKFKLRCQCRHNTCGDSCQYCCPGFVQKAWRAAVPESSNECEECNCHGHSKDCIYDEEVAIRRKSIDVHGNYEGGGVCQNCSHNTAGINCEECKYGFYRPENVSLWDPDGCRPCECDSNFTVGSCEPVTGRCYCKPQYDGDRCDRCAPGFRNFPECEPCPCDYNGTRNGVCEPEDNSTCPCKYNYAGVYCKQCQSGFYNFPECIECQCDGAGAVSVHCDAYSGQCDCEMGFGGVACDECAPGFFNYPFCHTCSCNSAFTTAQICEPTSGVCLCTGLATGDTCNQCISGYFDFPACTECECSLEGSESSLCNGETGKCSCKPNYQGMNCDECAPEFYSYPNCIPCNCDVQGSVRTTCDPVDGQCSCLEFITGLQCDECAPEYFNFPRCEDCKCDIHGIKESKPGECLAFTEGQCDCKDHVVGMYCDRCDNLHYDLSRGCIDCNCLLLGTLDGVASCDLESGGCWCKTYSRTWSCSECETGFYDLKEANYFGCDGCQCDRGGSVTADCNQLDGQCDCKRGVTGRRCDQVIEGQFVPTLLQYQFEVEKGQVSSGDVLRFGSDPLAFPGFSAKGYAEFSYAQHEVMVPIDIGNRTNGLFRVYIHYMQPYERSVGTVSFSPVTAEGSVQTVDVNFDVTIKPTLLSVGGVFVLTPGRWNVTITGKPGLLVDYFVLMPLEYYEASILQAKVVDPCKSASSTDGNICIMYTHPPITNTVIVNFTEGNDIERLTVLSPSHPSMMLLDGSSILGYNEYEFTISPNKPGKYVLVVEYASTSDHMQTIEVKTVDGESKFNIYSCDYAFLCRQVALSAIDDVMVYDISHSNMRVTLSVEPNEMVYVSHIYVLPFEEWTMEYVDPKRLCITEQGSDLDNCIPWTYPVPETGRKFELGNDEDSIQNPLESASADDEVKAAYLDRNTTTRVEMNLTPGRYVLILHYYNPNHLSFSPDIIVQGGAIYESGANVTHCPSRDGCRAVVTTDNGNYVFDITTETQSITITVPQGKSFWLDYILAIAEQSYRSSFLNLKHYDYTRKFFEECYGVGTEGLIDLASDASDFCRSAVFTLATSLNDGAVVCECSEQGTIGGASADCQGYGGQCPCKPNVIGRTCEQCAVGYHSYPDCLPCECNGTFCDEHNGSCICPPNTIKPDCKQCTSFTHSYHPLAGCVACDCKREGLTDSANLGCNVETGQCNCKENVEGLRCERCKPGFFAFPECKPCHCNERGSKSDLCDADNGQCLCKDNVEGQQCDRCKPGTYYLYGSNPVGCTKCFCFGATGNCSGTLYPASEITVYDGWTLLNMKTETPNIATTDRSISVDIAENGGPLDPSRANLYWSAPREYLGEKLGSYGGTMSFIVRSAGQAHGQEDAPPPAPLTGAKPTVILEGGDGFVMGWTNPSFVGNHYKITLKLIEANFIHQATGNPVSRADMMMILESLSSIRIKATDNPSAVFVELSEISFPITNYRTAPNSAMAIPSVETCVCPKGYTGESCQNCDRGYFRDTKGPYLGFCTQCDCFEHCESCGESGAIIKQDDCLHNTAGDRCDICKDGYIGDPMTGDPNSCQICPCPYSTMDGNFASSCSYDDEESLVCNCLPGYTGDRCELCDSGFFGNPAVIGGKCQECNCNGNSDGQYGFDLCDRVTGVCSSCKHGIGGKYCEQCAEGFYGDAVFAKNCTSCLCLECGTTHCDQLNGKCHCRPHVMGEYCDQCDYGYYDLGSCSGCRACNCAPASVGFACNDSTGQCDCAPNVVGLKCDRCAPGHWDYTTSGCKPCKCHGNGDCNPATGECECPPGTKGAQCDQCELPRHVLQVDGIRCEPCGSCSHDLLNSLDLLSSYARKASHVIVSASAGYIARQKYENLENIGKQIMAQLQAMDYAMDNLDKSFIPVSPEVDLSFESPVGSGLGEVGSGADMMSPLLSGFQSFSDVVDSGLQVVENAVAGMCNYTEFLLVNAEEAASKTFAFEVKSKQFQDDATMVYEDSLTLRERLDEGASGEEIEYKSKMTDGKLLLERIKSRDMHDIKEVSNAELLKSANVHDRTNDLYISPAEDKHLQFSDLSDNLKRKVSKLQEIRRLQNSILVNITEVMALNADNKKRIEMFSISFLNIQAMWADVNNMFQDSNRALRINDSTARSEVLNSEKLFSAVTTLNESYISYIENVGILTLVNQSVSKGNMLKDDADLILRIVNTTTRDEKISRIVNGANRYRIISNTVLMAMDNATAANQIATQTKTESLARNITIITEQDLKYAMSALLDVRKKKMILRSRDEHHKETIEKLEASDIGQTIRNLNDRLSTVDGGIERINQVDDEDVRDVHGISNDAIQITDEVLQKIAELEKASSEAPITDSPLQDDVTMVDDTNEESSQHFEEAKAKVEELKVRSSQINRMIKDSNIENKIKSIRRLIHLSRDRAGSTTVSMKFKPAEATALEYVQPRLPAQVDASQDYIRVGLYVNVSSRANNSILYWGDASSRKGDYISLETKRGYLHYKFKVGRGTGELVSADPINDNQWHKVLIQRIGNSGNLTVVSPNVNGGVLEGQLSYTKITIGGTGSKDMKTKLPKDTTIFVVGGMPPRIVPRMLGSRRMLGCIRGLKVNGEEVGLWNFKSYSGPTPGATCLQSPSNYPKPNFLWKFRGGDSYLRVRSDQMQRAGFVISQTRRNTIMQFRFTTTQSDALLFLIGRSRDQFFAIELIGGKLVVTCNFGWPEPRQATATNVLDINTQLRAVVVKAGIVRLGSGNRRMAVLAVNSRLELNISFTTWNPNVEGDGWVGGIYPDEVPEDLRGELVTIDTNFRGCMGMLAFHFRTLFSIYSAYERVGVTKGCEPETVVNMELNGLDYVIIPTSLPYVQEFKGFLTIRTESSDGSIIVARKMDSGKEVILYMVNGHIVFSDGDTEIRTMLTYDDGQPHTITFARNLECTLNLNVDDLEVKFAEGDCEDEEIGEQTRRRRAPQATPDENPRKTEMFALSPVHVYIGGSNSQSHTNFTGCIGNIQILGDKDHPGLITDGLRCGYLGNTRCLGKPKFNKCNMVPTKVIEQLESTGLISTITLEEAEMGAISAEIFTNGGLRMTDIRVPKRRNRHRNRGTRRQLGATSRVDRVQGIDAIEIYDTGYDGNCFLPLNPENSGLYYPGDGYAKYIIHNMDSWNWRFSLTIRTNSKEGIIFYICTSNCQEYIALYLAKGKLVVRVKFREERHRIRTEKKYNDGNWHVVTFQRKELVFKLLVDDDTHSEEMYELSNTFTDLLFFYVGGLQARERAAASTFMNEEYLRDFEGCIRNLVVNDEPVGSSESSSLLYKMNLRTCFDGETEPGIFFSNSEAVEDGSFIVVYNTYSIGNNLEVDMEIRPRAQSGILFAVGGNTGNFFQLSLIDGKVVARLKQETDLLMSVYDPADYEDSICDGSWHKVKVHKFKNMLSLIVDGNQVRPEEFGTVRNCVTDGPLYMGGVPQDANVGKLLSDRRQYTGCMRNIFFDFYEITPSIAIEIRPGVSDSCPLY